MYTPLREKYIKQLKEMSVDFTDDTCSFHREGYMYRAAFANGYGISIVKHDGSYGRQMNKWEIAVLKREGDEGLKSYDLCYDTPVTNDVIGYLTGPEVIDYAKQIAKLPACRIPNEECKLPEGGLFEHEGYMVSEPWDV